MYAIGASVGVIVGQLYNGTPLPMAGFVFLSGVVALLARLFLIGRGRTVADAAASSTGV